jgi:colanic acid/amylovoran biosynthesis glycosyltransferase
MSFAYLHESFPDPTKTFVYREVAAMQRLGMAPLVFSIRTPSAEEKSRLEPLDLEVRHLPPEDELRACIERERETFSHRQRKALSHWRGQKGDSTRVFEALWLGRELRRLGLRHVHAHFAGLAARTAWLVRELWGIGYSFTGHADDIFSPEARPITLAMLVQSARCIATETDYSRARLERDFPAALGKTFRVFNGLDPSAFNTERPVSADAAAERTIFPRIISVGRLVEKKGFPDLLQACALLQQRGISFDCEIIGGGPLEAALRLEVDRLGLAGVVQLSGMQPQAFVRQRLREARVFALAAQTEGDGGSDNLPTVIMEAMAAGLPVVSTRVAGIPEMVDPGATGALTPERDPAALADALAAYLTDPALAQTHGAFGRERAREKFSVDPAARTLARHLVERAGIAAPAAAITRAPELASSPLQRFWRRLWNR